MQESGLSNRRPGEPAAGGQSVWDAYQQECARLGNTSLDILFLAFLRRFSRFGYLSLGPIVIDVRLIEDIVDRTSIPDPAIDMEHPPLPDDVVRFITVLTDEMHRSGRRRVDELHFLLAFMRCGEGLPARVFGELGVTPEQVEQFMRSAAQPAVMEERLYSPEEAAEYLGVHVQTIRAWVRSGRLRASRLAGHRALRIKATDLQSVLEPVEAGEPGD
jgi:excisionase family DNA binding protein